jgi:hypothetical protein
MSIFLESNELPEEKAFSKKEVQFIEGGRMDR